MKRIVSSFLVCFITAQGLIAAQRDSLSVTSEQGVIVQAPVVANEGVRVSAVGRVDHPVSRSFLSKGRMLISGVISGGYRKMRSGFNVAFDGVGGAWRTMQREARPVFERAAFIGCPRKTTVAIASGTTLACLAYYGYTCVQLRDLILRLDGKDKDFLLTTAAGTPFYSWRLHADATHQESWVSARDMLEARDDVYDALCRDLSLSERSSELRLADENGLTIVPAFEVVGGRRRPTVETLRVISCMIDRELANLREVMQGLTRLDISFLARRQLFPVNRFGGLLSSHFILNHLRECERPEGATNLACENLINELSGVKSDALLGLLLRWQRYLQNYTQETRCFWRRSFSGNEQRRMYAYVLAAARYVRLNALKAIIDPHAVDCGDRARELAVRLAVIPAIGVVDGVPTCENVEALRAGVNRAYAGLDMQWQGQRTDSQKLVMRLLQVISLQLDGIATLVLQPEPRVLTEAQRRAIVEQMQSVKDDLAELRLIGAA